MRSLYFMAFAVMVSAGALFAAENPHLVDFGYFVGRTDVALSVLLVIVFCAGTLIGLVLGNVMSFGRRGRRHRKTGDTSPEPGHVSLHADPARRKS